ncbi:MAG TPA: hypothetical protein ENG73_11410 [Desulfobacterales bacterium]|nr:hypothetical protein [Desulfobacterales bacterium]
MNVKIVRADIVIIAQAHNPSIISPQWIKDKLGVDDQPQQFVHTPDFSLFDCERLVILADRQRVQITAKKFDQINLEATAKVAKKYVTLLNHIPYRALGLNFLWRAESEDEILSSKIAFRIGKIKDFSAVFPDHELMYGGIVIATKHPYILKLTIEPQGRQAISYTFNYHHELEGMDTETIVSYINNFISLHLDSERIVRITFVQEEKNA